jgi:hypothetical protein
MTETIEVTAQGVLVPRPLFRAWGDVREVEVEQRADAIIIKPKGTPEAARHEQVIAKMKAAGLIDELPWEPSRGVSAQERTELAKALSKGKSLSTIILEDREDRARP